MARTIIRLPCMSDEDLVSPENVWSLLEYFRHNEIGRHTERDKQ